jgi:hypothetical protein
VKKDEYLSLDSIKAFTDWFATSEAQGLSHNYYNFLKRTNVYFHDLPDALKQYEWHGDLKKNTSILKGIQSVLNIAVKNEDFLSFRDASHNLMKWGGTMRGNNEWLSKESNFKVIHETLKLLKSEVDDIDEIKRVKDLRFNSGLTKVYSLIADDFIIYDSRVAAALAWYVLKFIKAKNINAIPNELKFVCMKARDGKQQRNPLAGEGAFEYTKHNHPEIHAQWNIRASWILSAALNSMSGSIYHDQEGLQPLRALEAALFMWGYDLNTIKS